MGNLLDTDGTFTGGQGYFQGSITEVAATFSWDGEVAVSIGAVSEMDWHVQLIHAVGVTAGEQYSVCFDARAEAARPIAVNIDEGDPDYGGLITEGPFEATLGTSYEPFKYTFTASGTDAAARLTFNLGLNDADVYFDNVGMYPGAECGDPAAIPPPPEGSGSDNIVGVPAITTEGNQVLFGGQAGSVAGMSLFWDSFLQDGGRFYTREVVDTLKNDWNARLVRAAMGIEVNNALTGDQGYLYNPEASLSRVTTVVDAAIANDMYVIIDWHTHNAEETIDGVSLQSKAIEFFSQMASKYGETTNVIYEIYNEPDCPMSATMCGWEQKTTWSEIKTYAEPVIAAIRAIDPDNLIIVGTPFYSQFVDEAAADPITTFNNIAYTLHFYAATHQGDLRARAQTALDLGIPLFVTEWGTVEASGDGALDQAQTDAWMEFLYNNNISHANWSVSDKVEGASILKEGSMGEDGFTDADLTETGTYVKGVISNW